VAGLPGLRFAAWEAPQNPGAREVVGSNPTDPTILLGSIETHTGPSYSASAGCALRGSCFCKRDCQLAWLAIEGNDNLSVRQSEVEFSIPTI